MQTTESLRTVIVTGANKGIGYCIVEKLLKESNPYDIILTARNSKLGEEALSTLSKKYASSNSKVTFQQLNISDPSSIDAFADWIKTKRGGKFDVLINNAGYGWGKDKVEERLDTININLLETIDLTEKLLPYLADDGKILMISSSLGELSRQGTQIQQALNDPSLTKEKLTELTNGLIERTKNLSHEELGWSQSTYDASKALLNAYTRSILLKELKGNQQGYTVCPGWCRTDMGGPSAALPAEQGAETPVYLVNLPFKRDDTINCKFFSECAVRSF